MALPLALVGAFLTAFAMADLQIMPLGATKASIRPRYRDGDKSSAPEAVDIEIQAFGQRFDLALSNVQDGGGFFSVSSSAPTDGNGLDFLIRVGEGGEKGLTLLEGRVTATMLDQNDKSWTGDAAVTFNSETSAYSGSFFLAGFKYSIKNLNSTAATLSRDEVKPTAKTTFGSGTRLRDTVNVTGFAPSAGAVRTARLSREERGNVCEMLVMVDHSLYNAMDGDEDAAAALAATMVAKASKVYERQVLVYANRQVLGVKLKLKKLIVATDSICSNDMFSNSYLCKPDAFRADSGPYLRMHSRTDFSEYCLSYLLTHLDFDETLGVAYVGGVCSDHGRIRDETTGVVEMRSINAGFVTVEDPTGGPDAVDLASHTLAHEVGHNFGASHDGYSSAEGDDCMGYLMEPIAPSVVTRKRLTFSPCSEKSIDEVLSDMRRGRKDWCFVKEEESKTKGGDEKTVPETKTPTKTKTGDEDDDGGIRTRIWIRGGGGDSGGKGDADDSEEETDTGLLVGLSVTLSLIFVLSALFVAYAFFEQRFCFGPASLSGDPHWLRREVADTIDAEKRRISRMVSRISVVGEVDKDPTHVSQVATAAVRRPTSKYPAKKPPPPMYPPLPSSKPSDTGRPTADKHAGDGAAVHSRQKELNPWDKPLPKPPTPILPKPGKQPHRVPLNRVSDSPPVSDWRKPKQSAAPPPRPPQPNAAKPFQRPVAPFAPSGGGGGNRSELEEILLRRGLKQ